MEGNFCRNVKKSFPSIQLIVPLYTATLKKLENEGAVESYLDTSDQDKPRKMYKITTVGKKQLEEFQIDIEEKIKNLSFFLDKYKDWKESNHD